MGLLGRFAFTGVMLAFLVASLPRASCFALAFSVAQLPRASCFALAFSVASLPRASSSHIACFPRTLILARFAPYDTCVYHIVSRFTPSGFVLSTDILLCFATSGFALAFMVASIPSGFVLNILVGFAPWGFVICTHILGRFAPSGFMLCTRILSCFASSHFELRAHTLSRFAPSRFKLKHFLRFLMPWSQRERHIATILRQLAPNQIKTLVSALYHFFFQKQKLGALSPFLSL